MEMTETSTKQQQQQQYECIASCQALYDLSQNNDDDDKQQKKKMVETLPDMIHKAISDILKMNTTATQQQQQDYSPLSISNAIQSLNSIFYWIHILIDLLHPTFHHEHLFHNPGNADGYKKKKKNKKNCCLFLNDNVYGVTTVHRCKSLMQRYTIILNVFRDYKHHSKPQLVPRMNNATSIQKRLQNYHFKSTVWNQDLIIQQTLSLFFKTGSRISRERIRFIHQMDTALQTLFQNNNTTTTDKDVQSIQTILSSNIARHCNGTQLSIYGSCYNRLCLDQSFDIDLSLVTTKCIRLKQDYDTGKITAKKYQKDRISFLYKIRDIVKKIPEVTTCILIPHARVPVIKGTFQILKRNRPTNIEFDICLMNHVAVANSALIREYCNVGTTTHQLLLLVKMWAKTQGICSAAEGTLSSYSWAILAIFYLQTIGYVPNLQSQQWQTKQTKNSNDDKKMNATKKNQTKDICLEFSTFSNVMKQQSWTLPEKVQNLPLSALFFGFLKFYSQMFQVCSMVVSIRAHETLLPKTVFARSARLWRLCIEDPFETFESCHPHDLGMHISDMGQSCINHAFGSTIHMMEFTSTKKIKYDATYKNDLKRQFHYHCPKNALNDMKQLQKTKKDIDAYNDDKIGPKNSKDISNTLTETAPTNKDKLSKEVINNVTEKVKTSKNHSHNGNNNNNNKENTSNRLDAKKRKVKKKKQNDKNKNSGKQPEDN